MMNRIPRTRFVTLMAAAAGVTAGLSSMADPAQALVRTPTIATIAADTLPSSKAAAAPKKSDVAAKPAKSAESAKDAKAAPAADKKADAATKAKVVATGNPNVIPENDVCATEQDCRNLNGTGW
jgi:hypothetical protein